VDWRLILELSGAVVAIVGVLIIFLRRLDAQFSEVQKKQLEMFERMRAETERAFHSIDKKIHGVEIVVAPYAQDIAQLKKVHGEASMRLTEVASEAESLRRDLGKLERQVEVLQNRNR